MKDLKERLQCVGVIAVVMAGSWLIPPILQKVRHLCPVRPNGISEAEAIPVFARKYKTSCTTCHAPVPIKLNNFGEAFKNNGFRMPSDDEALTKMEMQELGAEAWKEDWKKDIYPGLIPAGVPLSFQMYLDARYDPTNETTGKPNARAFFWDVPHEFEIMTAGTLGKHISFWGNLEFKVRTADKLTISGSSLTASGIKETPVEFVQVYGQFDHIFNTSLLNLRIGRFEPRVVPFSRVSRRFIAEDFLFAGQSMKNGFNFKTMQGGAEIWGARSVRQTGGGLLYAFGILNGDGLTNSDNNAHQDFYGRLSYKFGGLGVAESISSSKDLNISGNWVDNSIRVGLYGYQGWSGASSLSFQAGGADIDAWFRNLNFYTTAWAGTEKTTVDGLRQRVTAWTMGADYILVPWLTGILRYEVAGTSSTPYKKRVIPAMVVGIRPNITWTTEGHIHNGIGSVSTGDDLVRTRIRFIF